MMARFILLLSVFSLLMVFGYCQDDGFSYRKFGSQTSYFENANLDTSPVVVQGCEPAYFWFLARHGATYLGPLEIYQTYWLTFRDIIVEAADSGRLDKKTLKMFESWNFTITPKDDKNLAESGKREHEELGERWRRRLDGLLNEADSVRVRAANFRRDRQSAHYFLKGVFQTNVTVPPSAEREDDFLLFAYNCPTFGDDAMMAETFKLESSQGYKLMVKEVGDQVGLQLTPFDVEMAWDMCKYETAWWPRETSPWCQIFSSVNLRLLDFREDLTSYYKWNGNGNEVNLEITQTIFEDIFQKFEEIEEGEREYKTSLYFGGGQAITPILAALGLYHDEKPLQASDWPESQDFQWKISFMTSFAANLGLVLLECEGEEEDKWRVMAYHQERLVKLPACGQEVCTLQQFKQFYRHWTTSDFC